MKTYISTFAEFDKYKKILKDGTASDSVFVDYVQGIIYQKRQQLEQTFTIYKYSWRFKFDKYLEEQMKLAICVLMAVINKQWSSLEILVVIFGLSMVVVFGAGTIIVVIESTRDKLKGVVRL